MNTYFVWWLSWVVLLMKREEERGAGVGWKENKNWKIRKSKSKTKSKDGEKEKFFYFSFFFVSIELRSEMWFEIWERPCGFIYILNFQWKISPWRFATCQELFFQRKSLKFSFHFKIYAFAAPNSQAIDDLAIKSILACSPACCLPEL